MEALRLFSDDMRIREAENDDYLDGVFVPKGTLVILPVCRPYFLKALSDSLQS